MKRKHKISILLVTALMFVFAVSGCSLMNEPAPQVSGDEFLLKIKLDLKEDIGLLIINTDIDGEENSGGISNADKTMLKKDETLYWNSDSKMTAGKGDAFDLKLQFSVVTEYCDPNYDNIYPEELVKTMEPISFTAELGKTYDISITGDKVNGYRASLVK